MNPRAKCYCGRPVVGHFRMCEIHTERALDDIDAYSTRKLDRSDAVPAETPEMAAPSVAPAVQQTVDPVGIPSPPAVASSPRDPVDGSAGQPLFAQTKENA